MIKLYKTVDGQLHYWETWRDDATSASMHYGIVGDNGEHKVIEDKNTLELRNIIGKAVQDKINEGYQEIEGEKLYVLQIEYLVDGFGTEEDLIKRRELQDRMDQLLGWKGLGHCDGGSSGSNTMEVCCYVVDFELAKKIIAQDLEGTDFADYTDILNVT